MTLLPEGFADLAPYAARFAVEDTAGRARLRGELTQAEREDYHAVMKNRIGPALDLLDVKPVDALDEAERRLMAMCLSFAHVALAVEVQGPDEERHASLRQHMRITRTPAGPVA